MSSVPEKDWKKISDLKDELHNKSSEKIFVKIEQLAQQRAGKEHKSYLELLKLIKKEEDQLTQMFEHLTRSTALNKISLMYKHGILLPEQLAKFTAQTQEEVAKLHATKDGH